MISWFCWIRNQDLVADFVAGAIQTCEILGLLLHVRLMIYNQLYIYYNLTTGRSESHPSLSLLGFPHCQRCFQEVIPKSSLWWFPHVNARFTECFFITYDLEIVEIIAFCWWAAILLNAKRYSRKIISAWQRWENISWTGRTFFLTPGTQKLPHPNGTPGCPRPSGSYPRDQILLAH